MTKVNEMQRRALYLVWDAQREGDPVPSGISSPRTRALGLNGNTLRGLRKRGLIVSDDSTGWRYRITPEGMNAITHTTEG